MNKFTFKRPANLDEWLEYVCFYHPVGKFVTAFLCAGTAWLLAVLIMSL